MSYRVDWQRAAKNDLADIWLTAPDQNAVTRAAADIDRLLTAHPLRIGRALGPSTRRVLLRPPLGVVYEVIEDDKRVVVQAVFAVV